MNPRSLSCCVPFCGCTAKPTSYPECEEILCGKHYRLASGTLRRRMARLRRAWKRERARGAGTSWRRVDRLLSLDNRLWARIKTQAIELAVGL